MLIEILTNAAFFHQKCSAEPGSGSKMLGFFSALSKYKNTVQNCLTFIIVIIVVISNLDMLAEDSMFF